MIIQSYDEAYGNKIGIALGYFDCFHIGHRKLLDIIRESGLESAVFTFSENPFPYMRVSAEPIYTFRLRNKVFERFGVDAVFTATPTSEFMNTSPEVFLDRLTQNKNVGLIVCGDDYTFGKDRGGNAGFLADYCKRHDIPFRLAETVMQNGEKISSSKVRECLKNGDLHSVNAMLGYNYFTVGEVGHGRGDGKKKVYPTLNIPKNVTLKDGVYATRVTVFGKTYTAVTNVGGHPTFGDDSENIESFLVGADKPMYGAEVTVEFIGRIRDISRFPTAEALKEQISRDIVLAKEWCND